MIPTTTMVMEITADRTGRSMNVRKFIIIGLYVSFVSPQSLTEFFFDDFHSVELRALCGETLFDLSFLVHRFDLRSFPEQSDAFGHDHVTGL